MYILSSSKELWSFITTLPVSSYLSAYQKKTWERPDADMYIPILDKELRSFVSARSAVDNAKATGFPGNSKGEQQTGGVGS